MTRVGAIDCGTNSIRLLIADVDRDRGALSDIVRRVEIVRLGHGVDKTGVIAPDAMARTLAQARDYSSVLTPRRREGQVRRNLGVAGCQQRGCLLYTSPSPRDRQKSRMPSSA